MSRLPAVDHLLLVPILLPLLTAAVLLMLGEQRHAARAVLDVASTLLGLARGDRPAARVDAHGATGAVYLPVNWPVPFGIVLVLDRLSALMLVLAAVVGLASLLFALARWHRAGVHFHPLFQIQLMGLNGAFLTGDLFNLFVFFEVLLAASYGLLLHGGGAGARARGPALHRDQPARVAAVPRRRRHALRRHRHAQHGRHGGEAAACPGRRPRPAARGRGHPRRRVPRQGRSLAAQLLAGAGLRRGERAGRGASSPC